MKTRLGRWALGMGAAAAMSTALMVPIASSASAATTQSSQPLEQAQSVNPATLAAYCKLFGGFLLPSSSSFPALCDFPGSTPSAANQACQSAAVFWNLVARLAPTGPIQGQASCFTTGDFGYTLGLSHYFMQVT